MSQTKEQFNDLLVESIAEGLTRVLGIEGAKSVTFYIDPHIAIADPDIYASSVTKLLGVGTEALFDAILENLHRNTGTPKGSAKGFGDEVAYVRRRFQLRG